MPTHVALTLSSGCLVSAYRKRAIYRFYSSHLQPSGFLVTCRREAEERRGTAPGDEGVLREERDRARPETGAEEQRPSSGVTAERAERAT